MLPTANRHGKPMTTSQYLLDRSRGGRFFHRLRDRQRSHFFRSLHSAQEIDSLESTMCQWKIRRGREMDLRRT